MRILVTGSKGQLGNELQIQARSSVYTFLFHDVDTLDITNEADLDVFCKTEKVDLIVNCAAYTAVDKAEQDFDLANLINFAAVQNIRKIAEKYSIKIIHISTDYVFDGKSCTPYVESDHTNPQSVYGNSKLKGEKEILCLSNSIIIRTSWLYSSFGNNFIKTILKYARERGQLRVVFDQIGTPTYARDLAIAIMSIIEKTSNNVQNFIPGIYHFTNEGVCSWYDFAIEICKISGIVCKISPVETVEYPLPAYRPSYSVLNKAKIKKIYGIEIPYWKDSLIDCMKLMGELRN